MLSLAKEMKTFTLGPLNPSVNVFHRLEFILNNHIPSNAHQLANGRLAVAATRMADCKLTIISDFESKEDVINVSRFYWHTFKAKKGQGREKEHLFFFLPCCPQALLCSCFVPGYCGMMPPSFKGVVSIFKGAFDKFSSTPFHWRIITWGDLLS